MGDASRCFRHRPVRINITSQGKGEVPLALTNLTGLPPGALTLVSVTNIFPFQAQRETTNSPDGVTTLGWWPSWTPLSLGPSLLTSIPTAWSSSVQRVFSFIFPSEALFFFKYPEHSAPLTHRPRARLTDALETGGGIMGCSPQRPGGLRQASAERGAKTATPGRSASRENVCAALVPAPL